jgi:hypothetical protein
MRKDLNIKVGESIQSPKSRAMQGSMLNVLRQKRADQSLGNVELRGLLTGQFWRCRVKFPSAESQSYSGARQREEHERPCKKRRQEQIEASLSQRGDLILPMPTSNESMSQR